MCVAAPVVVVGAIAPAFLVRLFTADPHLEVTGAPYLRLVALWVLPTAVILVCTAIMRSMGETKLPLQAAAAAIFVNLFLDWVLIFGNLGAPRLGLVGAGVGSLVARLSECVCIVIAMMRLLGAKGWGKRMPAAMRRKIRDAALPLVLTELIWVLSENTYVAVYGRIGTEALAAMTMTYPVQGIVMGLFSGLAAASVPVLGDDLGHERRDKALVDARALLRIGIVGAAVVAMIVALLAPFYVHAYSVTPSTATLSEACLWVFSACLVAKVGNLVMSGGILPAGGDTRYQLVMESLATWLLGVPLAFFGACLLGWPTWAVYALLSVEELARLLIGWRRVRSGRWMRLSVGSVAHNAGASDDRCWLVHAGESGGPLAVSGIDVLEPWLHDCHVGCCDEDLLKLEFAATVEAAHRYGLRVVVGFSLRTVVVRDCELLESAPRISVGCIVLGARASCLLAQKVSYSIAS